MKTEESIKLAVGYCRVSTGRQAGDGVSLDDQEQRIRQWCQVNGYTLVKMYVEVKSGKNVEERPRFQTCVRYAGQLKAALVVYDLTRASRSLMDALELTEDLSAKGADFVSLSEGVIDTTSPHGEMMFRIMAVFADFQRKIIVQKTREALSHRARNGKRYCRNAPFGYRWDADNNMLEEPEEQRTLGLVRSLVLGKKYGWCRTLRILNGRGRLKRNGKPWDEKSVKVMVRRVKEGVEQRPGAVKAERKAPLAVTLKKDNLIRQRIARHGPPQKKKYTYPEKRKYGSMEDYNNHRCKIWHPLFWFESEEETPEGFRNPTEKELANMNAPCKARKKENIAKYKVPKPKIKRRTVEEVIVQEQFEPLEEDVLAIVKHLLGENEPTDEQIEAELNIEDAEAEDVVEEPAPKSTALPWQAST